MTAMNKKQTITVSFLIAMTRYLSKNGFSLHEICTAAGIDLEQLKSPDHRITMEELNRFNDSAVEITKDSAFGLHIGSTFSLDGIGIIGYVMMNCSTLGEAFEKFCKYQELSGDIAKLRLVREKEYARFQWVYNATLLKHSGTVVEALMTAVLSSIRELTDTDLPLVKAHFAFPARASLADYKKVFRCECRFSEPLTAVYFEKKYLSIPVKNPNGELLHIMEKHAAEYLRTLRLDMSLQERIGKIIRIYCGTIPKIDMVAAELGMTVRNLQNRLSAEGVTFRDVREKIQIELAEEYLSNPDRSIAEISRMLGFSEPCVFIKFYKRCTGSAPGQSRKQK